MLLSYWEDRVLAWAGVAAIALLLRGGLRRPWHEAVAVGLFAQPILLTLAGFLETLGPLFAGGTVLPTYDRFTLSSFYISSLLGNLAWLAAGALVLGSGGTWRGLWALTPRRLATKLADLGFPTGNRSEGESIQVGLAAFPLLVLGNVILLWLTAGNPVLNNGDESLAFANMTLFHAVLLSAAASVGEELLYRGFLQGALARAMPAWAAIALQSTVFGFAHAGYGNLLHVLSPALFGLVAGLAAWHFGLWTAITLHFLIDIVAFGLQIRQPWAAPAVATLLLGLTGFSILWSLRRIRGWRERRAAV